MQIKPIPPYHPAATCASCGKKARIRIACSDSVLIGICDECLNYFRISIDDFHSKKYCKNCEFWMVRDKNDDYGTCEKILGTMLNSADGFSTKYGIIKNPKELDERLYGSIASSYRYQQCVGIDYEK